jgi:hypothetical protein
MIPSVQRANLATAIRACGLGSNLLACYDFGDAACYPGTGQTIFDLTANDIDLALGATTGVEASDPTFHGVAGRLSDEEYFEFDGGDFFRLIAASNPARVDAMHKANAIISMATVIRMDEGGRGQALSGSLGDDTAKVGYEHYFQDSFFSNQGLFVANGAGSVLSGSSSGTGVMIEQWAFHSVSQSDVEDRREWRRVVHDLTPTKAFKFTTNFGSTGYTSPSAAAATHKLEIGAAGNAQLPLLANTRMAAYAIWEGSPFITTFNTAALLHYVRSRWGF